MTYFSKWTVFIEKTPKNLPFGSKGTSKKFWSEKIILTRGDLTLKLSDFDKIHGGGWLKVENSPYEICTPTSKGGEVMGSQSCHFFKTRFFKNDNFGVPWRHILFEVGTQNFICWIFNSKSTFSVNFIKIRHFFPF